MDSELNTLQILPTALNVKTCVRYIEYEASPNNTKNLPNTKLFFSAINKK